MRLLRAFFSFLARGLEEMFTKDTNPGGSRSAQSLVVREDYIYEETAGRNAKAIMKCYL